LKDFVRSSSQLRPLALLQSTNASRAQSAFIVKQIFTISRLALVLSLVRFAICITVAPSSVDKCLYNAQTAEMIARGQ
jgi:hypothetical protein